MTGPLPDDQVRAMLDERAARVSPDAERAAMTAFRAAVRGAPDGKGGFAVIPQALSSRDARLPGSLAALGVVVVIVLAVLGGRISGNDVATGPSAVAGSSATTGPAASLAPSAAGSPTVLDPGQLEAALASGDLAGKIVVINGKLVSELCSRPASDCKTHLLDLPQLQITASDEPFIQAAWDAAIGGPAGPMTFRVGGDGSLDFLGVLGSVPDAPMSVDQLISTTAPAGRLVSVHGWTSNPLMPCPNPPDCVFTVLSAREPPSDSVDLPDSVILPIPVPARSDVETTTGEATFVARKIGDGWQLEGRYAAIVPEVDISPAVPEEGGPVAGDQLRAAVLNGSLAGRVIVIDGDVDWLEVSCAGSGSCTVPVPVGLGDLPIAADPSIGPAIADDRPAGPYAYLADGAGLTYYGTAADGLASSISVADLIASGEPVVGGDVRLVRGWLIAGAILTDDKDENVVSPRPDHAVRIAVAEERWKGGQIPGPFLVRPYMPGYRGPACFDANSPCPTLPAGWQVVAQVPDQPAIRVSLQSPTAETSDMSADQVRAGLTDGSLTGRVIVIDGDMQLMQVPCPRPGACTVPMLTRLGGVPITVDPAIEAMVANDIPDGPHVFIGDGPGLTYLGTMSGAVDAPMTVAQLAAVSPAIDASAVRFVEGTVGPIPCLGCPTGPLPGQWLSGISGSTTASVPVFVPGTIEPPPTIDRYLVRSWFGSPCDGTAPPSGVVWDCAAEYRWAIVAAVGDEPILWVGLR